MAEQTLPEDFKEFLKLLNDAKVKYLLIGGYAVGYHGYPRATADMDIWVALSADNAERLTTVFHAFGLSNVEPDVFLEQGKIIRMGLPPMRIEVLTQIDGVEFETCFKNRIEDRVDGEQVYLISKADLCKNKKASGRYKDLDDLTHLRDES